MLKRVDGYQLFGVLTLLISLFFLFVVARGSERALFISGILYSLILLFHSPLEQFISSRTDHPLRAYGLAVFINGLIVEMLAYASNVDRIRSGEKVFLFDPSSLLADLLSSLPYYVTFACIFAWAVRRYDFTAFDLGIVIFIGQAMTVDVFTHLIELMSGNVLGFLMAGLIMIFVFHAPIVLFSKKLQEQYPDRSRSLARYPVVLLLQLVPLVITFLIMFIKNNLLRI